MSKKKFTFEQLALIVDFVSARHDYELLGWSDSNEWFVGYFDKDHPFTAHLIVDLNRTLGLDFIIAVGEKYLQIKIKP